MQINANYAAGAEYDINGEGKREWKFLKLKNWELCNRAKSWQPPPCLETQPGLCNSSCSAKWSATHGWKKMTKQCRSLWCFHLLMSSLTWQVTLGMSERKWAHKTKTWVRSTGRQPMVPENMTLRLSFPLGRSHLSSYCYSVNNLGKCAQAWFK